MIEGIGTLLGFQLAGEFVARLLHVPIPGPIIGLILLFAFLQMRAGVAQVATPLLRNLAILFVPSGVGVLQYLDLFIRHGPAVLFVLVASTFATMAVTALVFAATQGLAIPLLSRKLVRRARFGLSRQRRSDGIPITAPERRSI